MKEITGHPAYELLEDKYSRTGCDYVILSSDEDYKGLETHRNAVIRAFEIIAERYSEYGTEIKIESGKMTAQSITADELLQSPPAEFSARKNPGGTWSYAIPSPLPYWFAFLDPPYGNSYTESDFAGFNSVLFPDRSNLEIFRWNDSFSDYFDAGREWWGTALWSVYDAKASVFVIIAASQTD